jgi:hypothetical protein
MASCAKQIFSNITPEQFTCICQQIESKFGVTLPGDSGQITQSGFTVEWNYDSQTQEFDVQCLDSPFFVSCSKINQSIQEVVGGCDVVGGCA